MTTNLPQLLCIGSQKCGTSWLYYNLLHHPDAFFPRALDDEPDWFSKEVHFFNRDDRFSKGLEFYSRRFEDMGERIGCDITPNYCLIKSERIKFIHEHMPDTRIILMIRNPIDRMWSGICHNIVRENNLRGADEEVFRRFYEENRPLFAESIHDPTTIRFGLYSQIIDRWESEFVPRQILTVFFGAIKTEPRELLRRILDFAGLRSDIDLDSFPVEKVSNKKSFIPMPEDLREAAADIYQSEFAALEKRFGRNISELIT